MTPSYVCVQKKVCMHKQPLLHICVSYKGHPSSSKYFCRVILLLVCQFMQRHIYLLIYANLKFIFGVFIL